LYDHLTGAATPTTKSVVRVSVCVFVFVFVSVSVPLGPGVARAEDEPVASPMIESPPPDTGSGDVPADPRASLGTAPPMIPRAKAYYDRGLELYAARNYAAAVDEFQRGFAIDPRREFLFAQAQALRLAGDCARAVPLYRQFLDSEPPPLQTQAAGLGLDRCGPQRSGPPLSPPPVLTPAQTPTPTPPPTIGGSGPSPPEPPRWWRDSWAGASLGVGVAALGVAFGFELASRHARDRAQSEPTEGQYDPVWSLAQQRRQIAVGALLGGAVLLAAGGARLLVLRGQAAAEPSTIQARPKLSVSVGRDVASLIWQGAFP
jgi:hypothetical protein